MPTNTFNCPNCGAPIDYDGSDTLTVRCPFCATSVIVPAELRPTKKRKVKDANPQPLPQSTGCGNKAIILGVLVIVFIAITVGLPIYFTNQALKTSKSIVDSAPGMQQVTAIIAALTQVPVKTAIPSPTTAATPAFAEPALQFGEKGIGAGMFNDARYITIDGSGVVYVADYQGGRVQAFESTGKYLTQWKIGDAKTIIDGMTANHKGEVFVASGNVIMRVEGKTGKVLSKLFSPNGGTFGEMAVAPDGSLAATWYEGRWGLITSLEGHRDDLVIFDPQDKISLTIPSVISAQTGELALDNYVTLDGQGNIYVMSDAVIYKYTPQGKFVDRFGSVGQQPDQLSSPNALTADGQGHLFISDGQNIKIFSPEGRYISHFPVKASADRLAFDEDGGLWAVSRDKVTKYILKQLE